MVSTRSLRDRSTRNSGPVRMIVQLFSAALYAVRDSHQQTSVRMRACGSVCQLTASQQVTTRSSRQIQASRRVTIVKHLRVAVESRGRTFASLFPRPRAVPFRRVTDARRWKYLLHHSRISRTMPGTSDEIGRLETRPVEMATG